MTATVFVINGPNLNLLGEREPEIYGHESLADIEADLIDWVHQGRREAAGLIVNAGGLTHTSVALLDALNAFAGPIVEVHLSNIHRRESFRHHSYVASADLGSICGLGSHGYLLALDALAKIIDRTHA